MAVPQIFFVSDALDSQGREMAQPYLPHQCSLATSGGGYFFHNGQCYQALPRCDYPRQVNLHTRAARDLYVLLMDEEGKLDWSDVPRAVHSTRGSDPDQPPLSVVWGKNRSLKDACEALLPYAAKNDVPGHAGVRELGVNQYRCTKEAFPEDSNMHHCLLALPEVLDRAECNFIDVHVSDPDGAVECFPSVRSPVQLGGLVPLADVLSAVSRAVVDWGP